MPRAVLLTCLVTLVSACDGASDLDDAGPPTADSGAASTIPNTVGPMDRPARLVTSREFDGQTPRPLLVLLHGRGASGAGQAAYFSLEVQTRRRDWLLLLPDGTLNSAGTRVWNATPACCDFGERMVDDVAYLTALIDEVEGLFPVSDVYLLGHSNGGFMAYRMACELSDRISAISSLAGSDFLEETDCVPTRAVSVLHIHGDADDAVLIEGDASMLYPPALTVVERWAARAGCDLMAPTMGAPLDLESSIPGDETTVVTYESGCAGAEAALWTIVEGQHIPAISGAFSPSVLDWLEAHSR